MEAAFPGYYTSALPKEYVLKLNFLLGVVLGVGEGRGETYFLDRDNVDILNTNPKFCSFD